MYEQRIEDIREAAPGSKKNLVLKREELNQAEKTKTFLSNTVIAALTLLAIGVLLTVVRHRRKKREE